MHTTATTASQNTRDSNPNSRADATFATSPIAQNSTAVHPTSCTTFSAEGRNEPRAPEHGAEQHHRRDALAFARERDERERDAPDQRADPDREERAPRPERRDEQRPGHHHEQPDRQVEPQDGEVEPAQIATFGRDGADAPRGGLALQDLLEAFGDARHVRSLRRCDPDQVPRVAGGGPRSEPEPASQPGSPDSPALGSMLPAR